MANGRNDTSSSFLGRAPAPWAARGLAWLLIALFAGAIAAAATIRVPEAVSGRFVLVPARGTDQVRAARDGIVADVRIVETQAVAKGERLFVIRSAQIGERSSELQALERQLHGTADRLANERKRYESQRLADDEEKARLGGRLAHVNQRIEEQRAFRDSRQARYRATLVIYENEIEITRREIDFRRKQYAFAKELAERTERYHREGIISWLEYNTRQLEASKVATELQQLDRQLETGRLKVSQLTSEKELQEIEARVTLDQLLTERKVLQASIDKQRHEGDARRTGFQELDRSLREERDRATIRTVALRRELEQSRGSELSVLAPCAGTVLRLAVQRPGAVVREGASLCELACDGAGLQAELTVPPSGIGQIKSGLPVKLLYDAFPYQRHGVRFGTVRWISPAAVGDRFRVFADIEDRSIVVRGEPQSLRAGMTGRADVLVGRRLLIAYAFEPLRQLRESLLDAPSGRGTPR